MIRIACTGEEDESEAKCGRVNDSNRECAFCDEIGAWYPRQSPTPAEKDGRAPRQALLPRPAGGLSSTPRAHGGEVWSGGGILPRLVWMSGM